MAADTAFLEGGPCNGQTRKITAAESDSGTLVCKDGEYQNAGKLRASGDIVFKYVGQAPPPGGSVNQPRAAHAHHGYSDLQRSLNRHWHPALSAAERLNRAALRSLNRAHKVKR